MKKFNASKAALAALGIAVLFFAVIITINFSVKKPAAPKAMPALPAATEASYEQAVATAFSNFKINDRDTALKTLNSLLDAVLPASRKEAHLALVTKLASYAAALKDGPAEGEFKALTALAEKYSWLKNIPVFSSP